MARISTYNTGVLTTDDYLLGTDDPAGLAPTKNFTVQALIDLTNVAAGNTNNFLDAVNRCIDDNYEAALQQVGDYYKVM